MPIDGTPGDDTLNGTPGNDEINGFAGNDTIKGMAGNDTIRPGSGGDVIEGGDGDDVIYFGPNYEFMSPSETWNPAGVDRVNGGIGNDQLVLDGKYATVLYGTHIQGIETLVLLRGEETNLNQIGIRIEDWSVGNARGLIVHGEQLGLGLSFHASDVTKPGAAGGFTVYGGSAADYMHGGYGEDWFHGGAGSDALAGYLGADIFAYTSASDSTPVVRDTIGGFDSGDKIDLSELDAIAGTPAKDAFVWSIDDTFHSIAGELRYTVVGQEDGAFHGYLEGDTDGDGDADLSISVGYGAKVTHDNVILSKVPPKTDFDRPDNWGAELRDFGTTYVGDFNGDGRDDLYNLQDTHAYFSDGATFRSAERVLPTNNYRLQIGDFNGDGMDDALRYIVGMGNEIWTSLPSGPNFGPDGAFNNAGIWTDAWSGDVGWYVGDFDGDGKDDIFRYLEGTSGADMFLSTGGAFVHDGSWTPAGFGTRGWTVGDFNGDGRDDVFRALPGESGADMWLSNGESFVHAGSWTDADPGTENWYVGDFNGDGMDDIFRYLEGTSGADMFLSTGSAFVSDGSWTPAGHGVGLWSIGDFDGDGSSDLLRLALPLPDQTLVPAEVLF